MVVDSACVVQIIPRGLEKPRRLRLISGGAICGGSVERSVAL